MSALELEAVDEVPAESRIVVAAKLPPAPYMLVDTPFVNALASVEERVAGLKVTDATTAQMAADLQRRLTTAGIQLEKARKDLKEPFIAAGRAIDDAARDPAARIEAAKGRLQSGLADFDLAEKKRIAKIEADRQAEIARLQAIADDEAKKIADEAERVAKAAKDAREAQEKERARVAAENEAKRLAGVQAPLDLGIEEDEPYMPEQAPPPPVKTEAQVALERAIHAPVAVAAATIGISMRVTLEVKEVDVSLLPDPFVTKTANMQGIRSTYCTGWKEGQKIPICSGVTFEVKRTPVSTRQPI